MSDLIFASATSLAAAIREKRVSSVEVVAAHLRRIGFQGSPDHLAFDPMFLVSCLP